ncbi:potassium-transporting ATPase subunit KdpA [Streptomyces sp. NPDC058316]|uniref:potassium-transporting ATPase subunit KdpA n=1 Tax=unclassified Streptomyces TaxID=2593676 RepID=UPI00343AFA25
MPQDGAADIGNPGPHGLTELIYTYTSNTHANGSSMAGPALSRTFPSSRLSTRL